MELLFKKTLMFLRGRITISNNQSFFNWKMILTVHFIKIFNSDFMSTEKEVQKTVYQSCKTVLTDKSQPFRSRCLSLSLLQCNAQNQLCIVVPPLEPVT